MKSRELFFLMALGLGGGAQAQTEDSAKTIQDLQNRVKALEQQQQVSPAGQSAAGAPVVSPGATPEEGAPDPSKARIEIYGQIMLDAIYDFKRVAPDSNATLRPSKIAVNCPGDPGCGKNGETIMSIRQSKLGFKAYVPTSAGELTTELEFDLFASGGGNTEARVLNAWGQLGMFGAGQYYTVFMDIDTFPNTIDYWGPSGMVFIRNPQLRITPIKRDGLTVAFSLEAPNSAVDTGKISDVDPALASGITGRNRYPDLAGSVRIDRGWGHLQVAGLLRMVSFETPSNPGSEPAGTETGYGLNVSTAVNTFGKDRVVGQVAVGRGIASYMNDGGVDLAPDANLQAETVKSLGWFVYYDHYWNERWSSSVGASQHIQDNTEGQLGNAFKKGSYSSANLLFYPVKNVVTGAEVLWGKRENKDGSSGNDS